MEYVAPGQPGSIVEIAPRYENFIGGKWLAPTHGKYRVDLAPATAVQFTVTCALPATTVSPEGASGATTGISGVTPAD